MKKLLSASLAYLTFGSAAAAAPLEGIEINGFLSIGMASHNAENITSGYEPIYNSYIRRRPSYEEDSDVGIQITKQLREDTSVTTQLLAQAANEWEVEAVWAFLKWEPTEHWQFRVGRVRTNPYMLSEVVDVGYAYPWVRPPEEVYSQVPSSFSNLTGADAKFKTILFKNDFSLSVFYGATSTSIHFPANLPMFSELNKSIFDTVRLRLRDMYSFNLKYGNENFSVRAGFETTHLTIDPPGTAMQGINTVLNIMASGVPPLGIAPIGLDYVNYFTANNVSASFGGLGYQFDWKNVVSMGEIVKRKMGTPIVGDAIGWYVMGGYHVKQFLPHITFARERMENNKIRRFNGAINAGYMTLTGSQQTLDEIAAIMVNTGPNFEGGSGSQSSVTLGLRWDVYTGIALKGEVKHVHPDNLTPGLFDYAPWGSANIYSLALDAVI
ncbi:MAG: hypothetical protein JSR17_13250 [Proteobacteria bacterium]|nr:hypothetical protein [Pseudomonadota bacterium]